MLNRLYFATRARLAQVGGDRGQGTLEYLGVVVIVAILVVAAVTAFTTFDLGAKLTTELGKILGS